MNELNYLSEAENKQRSQVITDLNNAFQQRNQSYTEFDDQTYDQWYISNKKASTGYIRPKVNKQDIRTVTGTTREKCNTVVTALLRYNFDFDIKAYNEEEFPEVELGEGMAALVRKSRDLETPTYEQKRALFYNEFVSQGNVFLLEQNVEKEITRKRMNEKKGFDDPFDADWKEAKELVRKCEVDMVPGINVYLGNIREFYMDNQPFIGLRRELHETEAEALYGHTKRWKQAKQAQATHVLNDQGGQSYNNWQMLLPLKQFKEEIRYYNVFTNTYQIMLDGVPMLPDGFPLEYLNGVLKYPLIKVNGEPISRYFAYCRGISSKNKFNQAMIDEMFRVILLKFRQSTNPPMANMTGKMLNKSIFYPSTIHQGIDPEKLKPIGPANSINGPEFDVFKLVKQTVDEASVSPIFEGNRTPGQQTAREIAELKAQSLQRLGMIMVGAIQMEEQLVWLRLSNILKNRTSPVDTHLEEVKGEVKKLDTYRTETLDTEFSDGKSGIQMIRMQSGEMPTPDQLLAEENLLQKRKGVEVRITTLNVDKLSSLKYKFYVTVTPIQKDHSELKGALFEESLLKAKQIWPTAVNDPYAQDKWATYQKLDPKKLFIQNAPQPLGNIPGGFSMPGGVNPVRGQNVPTGGIPTPAGQQAGAQTAPGGKTVGAQYLPQTSQQNKPSLMAMLQGAAP